MIDKPKDNKQADKILAYLKTGSGFSYEKFILKMMLKLPVFSILIIFILIAMGKISFFAVIFLSFLSHLITISYFTLRKILHVKNKVRCDWIV